MAEMELIFAFLAGLAMIASPCVLMLLPIILGASSVRSSRPLFIMLGFVTTFVAVALVFAKGVSLAGISPAMIRQMGIVFLALFAAVLWSDRLYARMGQLLQPVSDAGVQLVPAPGPGRAGGFALGLTLGAVWTPCSGPVLMSIVALVASSAGTGRGLVLLLAFAIGTAIPMLLVAYGGKAVLGRLPELSRQARTVRRVFAVLTVVLAAFMQWQQLADASGWIANRFQGWL